MVNSKAFESVKPLVSVYCMTYNQKDTIVNAIESIVAQKTDFSFELIIHDDASTDGTAEIVREYAKRHPDIVRPIFQSVNQYHKCNFFKEFFAPKALGEYIAICDGDDYWCDTDKLQTQVELMQNHPDCTMCFHAVEQLSPDGGKMIVRPLKATGEVDPQVIVKRGGMFCPTVSLMVRRDVMMLWPEFRCQADVYDYPTQVLAACLGKVYYIDKCMGVYRFASRGSWTAQQEGKVDYSHVENEIDWLSKFDEYSNNRFSYSVNFHIVHLWFTEYRKTIDVNIKKKAYNYIKKLNFKDRSMFRILFLCFYVLGKTADKWWSAFKKRSFR